ncbi:ABC transporter substrate-binding protein [Streptomyces sp. NBC_00828]|uniref:ABC transporter substrate-binding protein n=1 Tax=Streptomyces sp. NBC_00828 TaxID=2903678 RepID=UPI00386EA945
MLQRVQLHQQTTSTRHRNRPRPGRTGRHLSARRRGFNRRSGAAAGPEETRSLDELHQAALAEGGRLVIYAGGDNATQQDFTKAAFLSRFPGIDLRIIVDYSKVHDVHIDNQFETDTLVPDLAQLQTLQDFTRWDKEGRLLRYRPAGFSKVYDDFKMSNGACVSIQTLAVSFVNSTAAGSDTPKTPLDLIDPRWKGGIASRYPHDDDSSLYLFALYVEKYGWDWVTAFAAQDVQFLWGALSLDAVVGGQKTIAVGVPGSALPPATSPTRLVVPDGHPFMAWGQRAAIFKEARNPTAAKLYPNWQLSIARQQAVGNGWSVRTDVTPPAGLKPVWTYPNVHLGFPRFMADRTKVERWKQTFALYLGEVQGESTAGRLGLHPGA